jgi:hypothetical protein
MIGPRGHPNASDRSGLVLVHPEAEVIFRLSIVDSPPPQIHAGDGYAVQMS